MVRCTRDGASPGHCMTLRRRPSVMNEADPSPINLDELRMLPDWLREEAPAPSKQYAAHDYPLGDSPDRRGGRPGGFAGRNDGRDSRGGGAPDRRREGGGSRSGPPPRRADDRGSRDDRRPAFNAPRPEPQLLAPVRVEFLPDDRCLASINKQIRSTHLAYPLFGLARMFLQEPERHFVQFSVAPDAPAGTQLYQLGEDGPVTLDRATLEKMAFDSTKDQLYVEEMVQKEPLKGNFTNVARERLSGTLLGPTNYHAYQPALRSLYESRYSRRMSFEDFRRNVEVSTDPALIERWKEESRTTTTTSTRVPEGETPVVLNSPADVRTHFRQHHLDTLVRAGTRFKVHGSVARSLPEASMMQAIRGAHEQEMRYPAQFVQLLRQGLQNAGLHIFKHRKRVVYVSLARPTPFVAQGTVSPNVSAILETIAQSPLCTRKFLAERVLARDTSGLAAPTPLPSPHSEDKEPVPVPVRQTNIPEPSPAVESNVEPPTMSSEKEKAVSATEPRPAPMVTEAPTPLAPALVTNAAVEDPAARGKAALAADLRFLVQSGHIIEFHNGTFDLPLPPKAKEEGAANPNPARKFGATPPRPSGRPDRPAQPLPAIPPDAGSANSTFVATGSGVEEAVATTVDEVIDSTPSLLEVQGRAPTTSNLEEQAAPTDVPRDAEEVVITPSPVPEETLPDERLHDKVDEAGHISGPAAAPADLPVPGDSEDPPDFRS